MSAHPVAGVVQRLAPAVFVALSVACSDAIIPTRHPTFIRIAGGNAQSGPVGSPIPDPLVVEVLAQDTLPLAGVRVDFRVAAGSATLSTASVTTDESGRAITTITPAATGNIQVDASVVSSRLAARFLISADGPASAACEPVTPLVIAEIRAPLGGDGVCISAATADAAYVLGAFNAATAPADTARVTITIAGASAAARAAAVASSPARASSRISNAERASLEPLFDEAREWYGARDTTISPRPDTVGQRRVFNLSLAGCGTTAPRVGRAVSVGTTVALYADSLNPPSALSAADYETLRSLVDSLVYPALAGSFLAPSDIDNNGRLVLFLSSAVNGWPAQPGFGPGLVRFRARDLFPGVACPGANGAEILFAAIPDPGGALGVPRARDDMMRDYPRELAHELQHLMNAGRRIYINEATRFEEPWLDEGLSAVSEELLFYRMASLVSRGNIGAREIDFTPETEDAFTRALAPNIEFFRRFLLQPERFSVLDADTIPEARGALWTLLRFLVDARADADYVVLTRLLNSRLTGWDNLRAAFELDVDELRHAWATSLYTDDLFATASTHQQPSWNFRSLFASLGESQFPLFVLTPPPSHAVNIAPAGAHYMNVDVPAGANVRVSWRSATGGAIAPFVRWTLIRIR